MSRRPFALGFGAGILSLLLVAALLLLLVSTPAGPPAESSPTRSATTQPPTAPATVAPGETWLGDVELSSEDVRTADGPLQDVAASGVGVQLTEEGLQADRLDLLATLPFETAAEQIGDGIELYPAGDLAGMRRTVEILGRQVPIEATGRVQAVDGQLVIEPQTVDLGSAEWVDRLASAAVRAFVTIRHTVTGIPEGMRLDTVEVQPDGFRVELSGTEVSIGQ
jgi:hypothetical protein